LTLVLSFVTERLAGRLKCYLLGVAIDVTRKKGD